MTSKVGGIILPRIGGGLLGLTHKFLIINPIDTTNQILGVYLQY